MSNVQKFNENLTHTRTCIATSQIGPWDDHLIYRTIFFALFSYIILQILNNILFKQILQIAHIEKLNNSTWQFARVFTIKSHLHINISDVLIRKQVRSKGIVGWLSQSSQQVRCARWINIESFITKGGRMAFQFGICNWQAIKRFNRLLSTSMFLVFQEAVTFRYATITHQIKIVEFTKSLTYFLYLFIVERERQTTEINLIICAQTFEFLLLQIFFLEEISRFNHYEGCCTFNIRKFGVIAEEVLDSSRGHSQDGKSLGTVKLYIFYGKWNGKFWIRGCDNSVEILKDFFQSDLERQVVANYFKRMIFCDRVPFLFFRSQLIDCMNF